jgi:hypothetical protein
MAAVASHLAPGLSHSAAVTLTITPSAALVPPKLAAMGAARWMPMNRPKAAALAFWVCVRTRRSVPLGGVRGAVGAPSGGAIVSSVCCMSAVVALSISQL